MSSPLMPPRFVPTLTDVVQPVQLQSEPLPWINSPAQSQFENELTKRVMQQVEKLVEARLQAAISNLVLSHTQVLLPQLSIEIETVVHEAVMQAVSKELYQKV